MKTLNSKVELNDSQQKENEIITEKPEETSYREQLKFYSKMDKVNNVKIMNEAGYSISKIDKELHMDTRTVQLYLSMESPEETFNKPDAPQRAQDITTSKRQKKIQEVRKLKEQGYSVSEIHKKTGYAVKTIKKYLDPDILVKHALGGYNKGGKLAPYHEDINELLAQGKTFKFIEESIRVKGYTGAPSTIRMYVSRMRRLTKESRENHEIGSEIIERKHIVKLLYKPINQVRKIAEDQVKRLGIQYPQVGKIYEILSEFKTILIKRKTDKLKLWIEETEKANISEINSFIVGITRDLDAVKNAITYEYNNGLAEGSVNKLKVIKRIMYGRNSFDMLRKKVLWLGKRRGLN